MCRILGLFVLVMRIMNQETLKGKALYLIFGRFGRDAQFLSNAEVGFPVELGGERVEKLPAKQFRFVVRRGLRILLRKRLKDFCGVLQKDIYHGKGGAEIGIITDHCGRNIAVITNSQGG